MEIDSYGASDVGLLRLKNEDVFAQLLKEHFFILADGMGGHKAGEVAASEAVICMCQLMKEANKKKYSLKDWKKILKQAIAKTNTHVFNLSQIKKEYKGMGTTLCAALIKNNSLFFINVGDSRLYRIRKGRIIQLTRDHSLKDDLMARGELDELLALSFPYKNIITKAIGTQGIVEPDIGNLKIASGDIYILCSDGLTDLISDAQLHDITDETSKNAKSITENLILAAKKAGGNDNITVVTLIIK